MPIFCESLILPIAGLQSVPCDSKDNDTASMLVPHSIEVEILLLKFYQHGHLDVTFKPPIHY